MMRDARFDDDWQHDDKDKACWGYACGSGGPPWDTSGEQKYCDICMAEFFKDCLKLRNEILAAIEWNKFTKDILQ